jgi:TetR/AcrR family tetracycline transcriptional repressor
MARPKVPATSRRESLVAALDIIDTEGIEHLSIRRLAKRLDINGASLYHHFHNKEEIIVGAMRLALEDIRTPETNNVPWQQWLMHNAKRLKQALIDHPDLGPCMLRRDPLEVGAKQVDETVSLLAEEGVPAGAIIPILQALASYAIGSTIRDERPGGTLQVTEEDTERSPNLSRALTQRAISVDELFETVCGQMIDTIVSVVQSGTGEAEPACPDVPAR